MTGRDKTIRFDGHEARRLIRAARTAMLATLNEDGTPYGSLVKVASDVSGRPIIHVSRLAWHTRNLEADGRASLLFVAEAAFGDPLEAPRVTAIGHLGPCAEPACAPRFLACHPDAAAYAGFSDFSYWRMEIERCHGIAGFGRIETLEADAVALPPDAAETNAALAAEVVEHMNEHHTETLGLYATQLLGRPPADWRATTVDPDGLDLSDGSHSVRLAFPHPVATAAELRAILKTLAEQARK